MDDQTKCDFYDAENLNNRNECLRLTHNILDGAICQNPWHGMSLETVTKIKLELEK